VKREILDRLSVQPWLELVEGHVSGVDGAVRDYDPMLFVCFNRRRKEYEIHSLRNRVRDTYILSNPYPTLDGRIIEYIYKRDLNRHSLNKIMTRIDQHNEAIQRAEDKKTADIASGIAYERGNALFKKHTYMGS